MIEFGLMQASTQDTLQPVEVARFAEERGFDALFMGEHTHFPTAPHRYGDGVSDDYKKFYDPFVSLSLAAAVTERLKLGTGVCLLSQHHPITLAKTVATLDHLSGGRVILGVGTGWNDAEMANYGLRFPERWAVAAERIRAMREIWTQEIAEFHGKHVDFDPLWCWPKPAQAGGPPILIGGGVKPELIARRVLELGDGWIPLDGGHDLEGPLAAIRAEASRVGRPFDSLDLTVGLGLMAEVTEQRIREVIEMGFGRVLLILSRKGRDEDWATLERYDKVVRNFR
ncbi:MAG: LLM class F420-dependent oxidoreductase [Deltaproteobacteria bacterium]|nr:LLM class F420-dependent oxidoreductase [Deltaproteobacteria bacterium]